MFRKIVQPFYTAYVVITFLVSILIATPFFALLSIGATKSGREGIYKIVKYWSRVWFWCMGMPVHILGRRPREGRYVVVINHISYLDTLLIFPSMPSYFRPLGKKEISKVPILGFVYRQIVVMVDRSSTHSRALSMRLMWRTLKRESDIVIFPEGTFNETGAVLKEFYNGAFRLAIAAQTPVLPVLFPDTVHRWHYSAWWKLWPGKNRVVFLPPVPVEGLTLTDVAMLKQKVYDIMAVELAKYPR